MTTDIPAPAGASTRRADLHRLFWRVHFWAGFVTAPLVIAAALTGLLYALSPQIEAQLHGHLDRVPLGSAVASIDEQLSAARAHAHGAALRAVIPAHRPGDSTQVLFAAATQGEHAGHAPARTVYVNPYTSEVLGHLAEGERFKDWARRLHSRYQQGDGWRWPVELAASWMLVMLATGLYLWWPRPVVAGGLGWRALVPRFGRGRATWRDLHASVGLLAGGVLIVVLVTGLTWSRYSGENFRSAQKALGQSTPRPPAGLQSSAPGEGGRLSLQALYAVAQAEAPGVPLQLTLPQTERGVLRAESVDRSRPTQRTVLLLDTGSGRVLHRSRWGDLPALSRATALGIPFHRGEFGVWNQVLLVLAALGLVFSVISGVTMWWKRRPPRRVGAPPVLAAQVRAVPWPLWLFAAAMALAMPVFGVSAALFLMLELLAAAWRRRQVSPSC